MRWGRYFLHLCCSELYCAVGVGESIPNGLRQPALSLVLGIDTCINKIDAKRKWNDYFYYSNDTVQGLFASLLLLHSHNDDNMNIFS